MPPPAQCSRVCSGSWAAPKPGTLCLSGKPCCPQLQLSHDFRLPGKRQRSPWGGILTPPVPVPKPVMSSRRPQVWRAGHTSPVAPGPSWPCSMGRAVTIPSVRVQTPVYIPVLWRFPRGNVRAFVSADCPPPARAFDRFRQAAFTSGHGRALLVTWPKGENHSLSPSVARAF